MCTLLAFVDDATSRLMLLRFVASESAFDYFRAMRSYLQTHGKPIALYSDKHGIFRVNRKDAVAGEGITQFGRALSALNIDIICANSPQAKGRVERAFATLQDRLVKELRLAGISTIAAANAWLWTPELPSCSRKARTASISARWAFCSSERAAGLVPARAVLTSARRDRVVDCHSWSVFSKPFSWHCMQGAASGRTT